jgi:hypothetical protein
MASDPQARRSADDDGVRVIATGGARAVVWLGVVVAGIVVAATVVAVLVIRRTPESPRPAVTAAPGADPPSVTVARPAAPAAAAPAAAAPDRRIAASRRRPAASAPAPARVPAPSEPEFGARDLIGALRDGGETEGIAAFGLPGSDPVKPGIVVPDGFELPEGYVRHYQVTDEGEALPAILMFHPDYEFVDERGVPVAVPADRVVPPELAPPGLPIRMLEVPGGMGAPDPTS